MQMSIIPAICREVSQVPCPGVEVAHKQHLPIYDSRGDALLQLCPDAAGCHADAVTLHWWYIAYNQVQILIEAHILADFQYSKGVGCITGYSA